MTKSIFIRDLFIFVEAYFMHKVLCPVSCICYFNRLVSVTNVAYSQYGFSRDVANKVIYTTDRDLLNLFVLFESHYEKSFFKLMLSFFKLMQFFKGQISRCIPLS